MATDASLVQRYYYYYFYCLLKKDYIFSCHPTAIFILPFVVLVCHALTSFLIKLN